MQMLYPGEHRQADETCPCQGLGLMLDLWLSTNGLAALPASALSVTVSCALRRIFSMDLHLVRTTALLVTPSIQIRK